MATLKTISELIDSTLYEGFSLTNIDGNVDVFYYTSEGYSSYTLCDVFVFDGGSLIAFKHRTNGEIYRHDFTVSNGVDKCIIQSIAYENSLDILSGEQSYPYSFYTYLNSVNLTPEEVEETGIKDVVHTVQDFPMDKCYHETWGPMTFYDVEAGYALRKMRTVFSISGCAAIIRIDTDDTEIKNRNSRIINTSARSIRGVFKAIDEWRYVSGEPFNNTELPALKADEFLTSLELSGEALLDIISDVPEMRVSQYLKGTTTPLGEFEENTSVPESLKQSMLKKMRYRTLQSLVANHPYSSMVMINNDLINTQKIYIETRIFQFLIDNSIDVNTADIYNVQSIFYKMNGNSSAIRIPEFIELCEAYCGYK